MSNLGLVIAPRMDPREQEISRLRSENERLTRALADANQEIHESRVLHGTQAQAVQNIREILEPLFSGLKRVFAEMEHGGFETYSKPQNSAVWDSWKQKVSGTAAKAIDVLMLHGTMNAEQLRIHLGCATRTCYNIIVELNRAKLINKQNGQISLKEL